MTEYKIRVTPLFKDTRYPPKHYSFTEILQKITAEGLNTFEIVAGEIDEIHEPSMFFVDEVAPSWSRPPLFHGFPPICYALEPEANASAIAKFFCGAQLKFNCRLSRSLVTDGRTFSVEELQSALDEVEAEYPGEEPPPRMYGRMQLYHLDEAVTTNILGALKYYTEGGEHINHVIEEAYDHLMFDNVNTFGDLNTFGVPLGFGVNLGETPNTFPLPPSISFEGVGSDKWDIYLVEDSPDKVEEVRLRLQQFFRDVPGVEVTTHVPIPVASYRLSRTDAEKLEFMEPFVFYPAKSFFGQR